MNSGCIRKAFEISVILTVVLTNGCKTFTRETFLPFQTIENQDWAGTGVYYSDHEPVLMVISQNEDLLDLDQLVTDSAKAKLYAMNQESYFAVLVFQGWKPHGGYGVQIERIVRIGDLINIYAKFFEPKEDEAKTDEVVSPYQLIQVEKGTYDWNREFTVNLVVGGKNIFSKSQFIP